MPLHHIALAVKSFDQMIPFYTQVLGLTEIKRHFNSNGSLRSVWFDLDGVILMLEDQPEPSSHNPNQSLSGWQLVALSIKPQEREVWIQKLKENQIKIEKQSDYSIYFWDPEGNRLAFSHYPNSIALS